MATSSWDPIEKPKHCENCGSPASEILGGALCPTCAIRVAIDNGETQRAYDIATDEGISPMTVLGMIQAAARYARRTRAINAMHQAVRAMDAARSVLCAPAVANDNAAARVMS